MAVALWMLIGVAIFRSPTRSLRDVSPGRSGVRWARRRLGRRRRAGVSHLRIRSGRAPISLSFSPRLHLQHPAEHRAVGRPLGLWMEREARRDALVLGRARLRRRCCTRLPGHRPDLRRSGWSGGCSRSGRPSRDADQLADALRLRAWAGARRCGDGRRLLPSPYSEAADLFFELSSWR